MSCSLFENNSGTLGEERKEDSRDQSQLHFGSETEEKTVGKRAGLQGLPDLTALPSHSFIATGRRGLRPVATREDQPQVLWAGTATYPTLPKTKDGFPRDRYGNISTNHSTCSFLRGE